MSKVRINDLARELEIKSRAVLDGLPMVGVTERKTHSSSVEDWEAAKFAAYVRAHPERFYRQRLQPRSPVSLIEVPKPPVVPTVQAQPQAMPVGIDESKVSLGSELPLEPTIDASASQPAPTEGEGIGTSVPRSAQDSGSTLNLPEGFSLLYARILGLRPRHTVL
jgi:translation initiation factor IF-2